MIRRLRTVRTRIHYWLRSDQYTSLLEKNLEDLRGSNSEATLKAADFLMAVLPPLQRSSPFKAFYTEIVLTANAQLLNADKTVRFKMADLLELMVYVDMRPTTELLLLLADEAPTKQCSGILTVLCKVLGKDACLKEFPSRRVLSLFEKYVDSNDDIIRGKALAGAQLMDYYFKASLVDVHKSAC
ncbi:unnamed protein product [Ixodes hexagonus]